MWMGRAGTVATLLLCCGLLAACGGLRAPSLGLPGDAVTAPANPQMGQVVNGAYVVAPGDTLATISARTNTPIRALIDNNNLQPPYNLRAGQELRIAERQTYTVQSGDTLIGIARRFNVSQSALVDLNDLEPPFIIRIGQSLTLPSTLEAPQQTMAAQQPIVAAPAGEINSAPLEPQGAAAAGQSAAPTQVAAGQGGAKPFSPDPVISSPTTPAPVANSAASAQAPAKAPGEPDLSAAEEAAERAYEEAQQQKQQQTAAVPATPVPTMPVTAAPVGVTTAPAPAPVTAPVTPPVETASVAPTVGPASAAGFSWPVQGKVIAKFGATADGLRNDGINIAAPAGAPVMAAANGTVAYAGNQLRGFGNLVLLRHDNGLITAYAHNQSLLVEKGAKVKRGDVIARVGSTGSVDQPQLHFEIRKGEQAVDPLKYLDG